MKEKKSSHRFHSSSIDGMIYNKTLSKTVPVFNLDRIDWLAATRCCEGSLEIFNQIKSTTFISLRNCRQQPAFLKAGSFWLFDNFRPID
jgi:hypothetical protein